MTGLCLAFAVPAAFAEIHKCVDERSGSVAYSDLPCRHGETQTVLGVPRAGTRPTPVAYVAELPVRPLQLWGSPQDVMATAALAIRQMAETGEGCQNTLLHRRAAGETPADCRAFLAQLGHWRAPVVLELAKLSVDKEFATPTQTAKLASLVETLGKVRGYEQTALQRLGPDAGTERAGR
jgi:Domain of unknown function (DUF4124)